MSTLAHTVERSVVVEAPAEEAREALRDEDFLSEWLEEDVELTVDAVAAGARVTVIETSFEPGRSPLLAAGWTRRLRSLPLLLQRLPA